jgi:hypothetical protein
MGHRILNSVLNKEEHVSNAEVNLNDHEHGIVV